MPAVDTVVKCLKEDFVFNLINVRGLWKICPACLHSFFPSLPTADDTERNDEPIERICSTCAAAHPVLEKQEPRKERKIKWCKYCLKRRKLFGVWCRPCRNDSNRGEINRLLNLMVRSYEEETALEFLKQTPVGRKEFA